MSRTRTFALALTLTGLATVPLLAQEPPPVPPAEARTDAPAEAAQPAAEEARVLAPAELRALAAREAEAVAADRRALAEFLARPEVRKVAASAGLDIRRAASGVALLDEADAARLAERARDLDLDEALPGGDTIVITTTTLIIVLLVLLIILVA